MMYERIAPDDPIIAPTIVMRELFNMNPSAHSAQPEYEFNTVITTGMSAPGIIQIVVIVKCCYVQMDVMQSALDSDICGEYLI